jgi:CheY-like chemotaxis protein
MLTFSRGGAPIKKITNIVEIVRQTVGFVCRGSNVRCRFSANSDIFEVSADADQISQVITNIVLNAISAMHGGGIVEVSVKNTILGEGDSPPLGPGHYVIIDIADQGSGIPPELLDRIFEPFFSTKEGGEGLGLATSFSIVRKHGGYIFVSSEVGKGSRFAIYLPATGILQAESSGSKEEVLQEDANQTISRRILIVDDEEAILEVLSQMFRTKGFEVVTATDGNDAIRLYRDALNSGERFDAVVMDLTIPGGLGGKETIKILRQVDPDVKAIVSSGYFDDPVMAEYAKYGFKGVLPKPYLFPDLYAMVRRIIEGK